MYKLTVHGVDVVTAAVTPTPSRRESVDKATPGGGVTPDDDVDGHMTKTDTCYSLLCPDVSTPDANIFNGLFDFIAILNCTSASAARTRL